MELGIFRSASAVDIATSTIGCDSKSTINYLIISPLIHLAQKIDLMGKMMDVGKVLMYDACVMFLGISDTSLHIWCRSQSLCSPSLRGHGFLEGTLPTA